MTNDKTVGTSRAPDGGWGWVAVIGGFIYMMILPSINRSFSLINGSWQNLFSASPQATSGTFSLYCVLSTVSGPLCSFLVERLGCRRVNMLGGTLITIGLLWSGLTNKLYMVYIAFGVFVGLGRGLLEVGKEICFSEWFDKRRATATGFSAVAAGVGTMGLPPLLQLCSVEFGIRGAMLILAGFAAHTVFAGILMRSPYSWELKPGCLDIGNTRKVAADDGEDAINNHETGFKEEGVTTLKLHSIEQEKNTNGDGSENGQTIAPTMMHHLLRNPSFLSYCLMMGTNTGCSSLVNSHLAGLSVERGVSLRASSYMISATGALLIICRFTTGLIFDVPIVRAWRKEIMGLHGAVMGVALVGMALLPGKWSFITTFFVYIIAQSVFGIQYGVILSDIIAKDCYSRALGVLRFCRGFGFIVGPLVGGVLKDVTHTYDMSFLFGGLLVLPPAIVFLTAMIYHRRKSPDNIDEDTFYS